MTIPDPAPPGEQLAAIAACLTASGITARLDLVEGITPVLSVDQPGPGPDPTTVSLAPALDAAPGLLEGTCLFTPAPGATPEAAAATVAAILDALRPPQADDPGPAPGSGRPSA